MNVLLITPDAVGGTLLERVLTTYMQMQNFDKPVIDVGHIETGIEVVYDANLQQNVVRGYRDNEYHKMQSVTEIREILESADHYKIIKLPHYSILGRRDPLDELIPFYRYLNDNYFIISCRRENLFEHSISWALNKITSTLNVYSPDEKISKYGSMYAHGISLDPLSIKQSLDTYTKYIQWSDENFRIGSYYFYEKHMPNIEDYVLSLPMFASKPKRTWKDTFGIEFNDWNKFHYYQADVGALLGSDKKSTLLQLTTDSKQSLDDEFVDRTVDHWEMFKEQYLQVSDSSWPEVHTIADWENLPLEIRDECEHVHNITYHLEQVYINKNIVENKYTVQKLYANTTSSEEPAQNAVALVKDCITSMHKDFIDTYADKYNAATTALAELQTAGILKGGIPVKKQTMQDKKAIVKNFNECINTYNKWVESHPEYSEYTEKKILDHIEIESSVWKNTLRLIK